MSLLPAEVHGALTQLLHALSSNDNNLRSQAEEQFSNEWVQGRPDVLLIGLVEQIQGAEEPSVRLARLLAHLLVVAVGQRGLTRPVWVMCYLDALVRRSVVS